MIAAMYMNRNMSALNTALERMASGIRINTAKDDPSGNITTDVLRGELTGIKDAITNTERADNLMATAEGAIANISDLLLELQAVVHEAANSGVLTQDEIDAKQLQVDNLVAAINQTVRSTSFCGQNLIDGSLGYVTQNVDPSAVLGLTVFSAPAGSSRGELVVNVTLQRAAEQAAMIMPDYQVAGDVSMTLTGPGGAKTFQFRDGMTAPEVALEINRTTMESGLRAELVDPSDPTQGIRVSTVDYGSKARITVAVTAGNPDAITFQDSLGNRTIAVEGLDARATVNGHQIVGRGKMLHYATASMTFEMEITDAFNRSSKPAQTDFVIASGGAMFQVGPQIGSDQQVSFGIVNMEASNLGWPSVGYLSDVVSGGSKSLQAGNLTEFQAIVERASTQVASMRSRIGSFQNNTLKMASKSLQQTLENIAAARSQILDTDYAAETSAMVRQQVLADATRAAMSMAQQIPQHVLSLLFQ
jgi:flagellin-like hook-associated protein FlgL